MFQTIENEKIKAKWFFPNILHRRLMKPVEMVQELIAVYSCQLPKTSLVQYYLILYLVEGSKVNWSWVRFQQPLYFCHPSRTGGLSSYVSTLESGIVQRYHLCFSVLCQWIMAIDQTVMVQSKDSLPIQLGVKLVLQQMPRLYLLCRNSPWTKNLEKMCSNSRSPRQLG